MLRTLARAGIILDFRAGVAYYSAAGPDSNVNNYITLGRTDAKQGWTWLEKPLTETFADLNTALLTERTADALAR